MTVLVTGAAGYIGGHTVLALLDKGFDVIVLDNLSTGVRRLVSPAVTFIEGNVGDVGLLDKVMQEKAIEAVLHFAGSLIVPESVEKPLLYYDNNTANTLRLIQACVRHGVNSFVFSSTAAVYGSPVDLPVREDSATMPINPYGRSKLMTEWMLADAVVDGLRSVCLRYFNVAGADPLGRAGQSNPGATALIKAAAQVAVGAKPSLIVYGTDFDTRDGTGVRDYIHVTDLADAHVLALQHLLDGGGSLTLNCGYGTGTSVMEVIKACEAVMGRKLPVVYNDRRPGDPAAIYSDAGRIRKLLGWTPLHADLEEIVRSAIAWEERVQRGL